MLGDFTPQALRRTILRMAHQGRSVHIPCAFSIVELVSLLYSKFLKFDPKDLKSSNRDHFLLSKGHGVMAIYAALHALGWISENELDHYFSDGSRYFGLSEAESLPGLEVTAGSLGHGLPVAAGIALGLKLKGDPHRVYCLVGDGEMNEGSIWEALSFAAHHKLNNLVVIVDANGLQALGKTEEILSMEPLVERLSSFGHQTLECDGHNSRDISEKLDRLLAGDHRPKALVARTVKGKGVSFMEGNNEWHYTRLSPENYERALRELRT